MEKTRDKKHLSFSAALSRTSEERVRRTQRDTPNPRSTSRIVRIDTNEPSEHELHVWRESRTAAG
jgi:hypothetical protein